MALTGGVLATTNATQVLTIKLGLTLAAGGDTVNLDATDLNNRTVISYIDSFVTDNNLSYTTLEVVGDRDSLLEQGELSEITIDMAQCPDCDITENETFTLELKPPTGSYMVVQRTTPASMSAAVINLN